MYSKIGYHRLIGVTLIWNFDTNPALQCPELANSLKLHQLANYTFISKHILKLWKRGTRVLKETHPQGRVLDAPQPEEFGDGQGLLVVPVDEHRHHLGVYPRRGEKGSQRPVGANSGRQSVNTSPRGLFEIRN